MNVLQMPQFAVHLERAKMPSVRTHAIVPVDTFGMHRLVYATTSTNVLRQIAVQTRNVQILPVVFHAVAYHDIHPLEFHHYSCV